MENNKIKTLYVTRNGLLEPLGQSQVMNYLRGLSKNYLITVISYEKPEDFNNKTLMANAHTDCKKHGIKWLPQPFQPNLNKIMLAFNMFRLIWIIRKKIRHDKISLIHARSYLPAAIALAVNKLTGVPFIFDMRALWPEELIISGRIRRASFLHRIILKIERACLAKSAAVVSLTNAAINHLKLSYPDEMERKNIFVIPTCADLKSFKPENIKKSNQTLHGCIGTILSSWFLVDCLATWIKISASKDPNARFELITRDNAKVLRKIIDPSNSLLGRLSIYQKPPSEMPSALKRHDLSVMFFTEGISKLGSAPTRMAEALGCGIPLVVNKGVGDVAEIVRKFNIGVVVEGSSEEQIKKAFDSLLILKKDPNLNIRCRTTAESLFSLEMGTEAYQNIYKTIINVKNKSCAA